MLLRIIGWLLLSCLFFRRLLLLLRRWRLFRSGIRGTAPKHKESLLDASDDCRKVLRCLLETLGQRHFLRADRRRYNFVLQVFNLLAKRRRGEGRLVIELREPILVFPDPLSRPLIVEVPVADLALGLLPETRELLHL